MPPSNLKLHPETVWKAVQIRTASALASGALRPIENQPEIIVQDGVQFMVRVARRLSDKARAERAQSKRRSESGNPFWDPDPQLVVGDVSSTHRCILNKFNVLERHLLIVTRVFETQEALLTRTDFDALAICMAGIDGLAFYNAGAAAGASQAHKHLQLVPTPIGSGPERTPLDARLTTGQLPFEYARAACPQTPEAMHLRYLELLREIDCSDPRAPYNLLLTRDWMLAIPRSHACYEDISVNALGFAGSFFVRSQTQLDQVRAVGPMTILQRLTQRRE